MSTALKVQLLSTRGRLVNWNLDAQKIAYCLTVKKKTRLIDQLTT